MTKSTINKPLWVQPWGVLEGFAIALGLLLLAILLEFFMPIAQIPKPTFPKNAILLISFAVFLFIIKYVFRKSKIYRWFASVYAAIPSIVLFLLVLIPMGVIPQFPQGSGVPGAFFNLLSSWIFLIPSFFLLFTLGVATLNRIFPFTIKNIVFSLNHLGLWLCFSAGLFGHSDKIEATVQVNPNEVVWYGTSSSGNHIELPIAIELQKFVAEFYQPRLALFGEKSFSANHDYDLTRSPEIKIDNLLVRIISYLPKAYPMDSSYIDARGVPYAGPAAKVDVLDLSGNSIAQGWISNQTRITPEKSIYLPDGRLLRLLPAEPKYFGSNVKIYSKASSSVIQGTVEVNKPIRIDGWWVYQYSYDNIAGTDSTYSSFKVVYDPWMTLVYIGFAMILMGGIGMAIIYSVKI
ncbi:MAG TPA: hypothetical protein ENN49_05630 [Bacteroidales bacterium]|nr:hypothetical protein [Bacteroidales bacterium]